PIAGFTKLGGKGHERNPRKKIFHGRRTFGPVVPLASRRLMIEVLLPCCVLTSCGCRTFHYFFGRQVLLVSCNRPNMSEGVLQGSGSVAVELIAHRFRDLRTF